MQVAVRRAQAQQVEMPWLLQFAMLLRMQYTEYRGKAALFLAFSLAMPIGIFWVIRQHVGEGQENAWLLAGALVLSICYGSVNFIIQRVGWMKLQGETDFYDTLPIGRSAFLAAIFVLGLLSSLPGLLGLLIVGRLSLGLSYTTLEVALPLVLLATGSLSIIGVALGTLCKSMSQVLLFGNLVYLVVTFLCPVLVPLDKLPFPMRITSYLLPPGEAAIALSDAMNGTFGTRFWVLTALLWVWLFAALALTVRPNLRQDGGRS